MIMKRIDKTACVVAIVMAVSPVILAQDNGAKVPLEIKLPSPAFKGTPKDIQLSAYVEPLSDKPRPLMMVPAGLKNIAKGAKITASDRTPPPEALAKIADGDKEAAEQSIIYLRKDPSIFNSISEARRRSLLSLSGMRITPRRFTRT